MAEELRVIGTIEKGFVDTGRPGPGGLDALGDALGRFGDLVGDSIKFAEREAKLEEQEVVEALSSPLLSEDEIREIEEASRFPLAKIRAQNRRGEFLVQKELEKIQDAAANAADPIEARRILREYQQRILDGVEDPAVQAGIRERMAREGSQILGEASKRRIAAREAEEIRTTSEDLRASMEYGGAVGLFNTLAPMMEDEVISGGSQQDIAVRGLQVIENFWRDGDDDDPSKNPNTDDALEAIDLVLDNGNLDAKSRGAYTEMRDKIVGAEATRARTYDATDEPTKTELHAQAQIRILNFKDENPTTQVPISMQRALIETAPTAPRAVAAREWLKDNVTPVGVLLTDTWEEGRRRLAGQARAVAQGLTPAGMEVALNPASMASAIAFYERVGANLDPKMEPEQLRNARDQALQDSVKAGLELDKAAAEAETHRDQVVSDYTKKINQAKAVGQGEEEIQKLNAEMNESLRNIVPIVVQHKVSKWLARHGYADVQFDNPLLRVDQAAQAEKEGF